jgi:hypothetical protein
VTEWRRKFLAIIFSFRYEHNYHTITTHGN